LPEILRELKRVPLATMLMRCSWALYAASLLLPAANSTALNAARATYGWEIVVSFPLFIVNPLSLTHPMIWAYITALFACNVVVLCSSKLRRHIVEGRASAHVSMGLAMSFAIAISVAAGGPALVGARVDRLLVGYYVWVLSIVTCIGASGIGSVRRAAS
jgi:hypothetical protein